mgnify:CR=1 FL=1
MVTFGSDILILGIELIVFSVFGTLHASSPSRHINLA